MKNYRVKTLSIILVVLFMVTSNNASFGQKHKALYIEEKQFLKANLKDKKNMDSRIIQLTPPKLFWINEIELYGIYHTIAKDPIPAPTPFILLPDGSIYHTSEILIVLNKLNLFPKSEDEAIKYAALIIYCLDKDDHVIKKDGLLLVY